VALSLFLAAEKVQNSHPVTRFGRISRTKSAQPPKMGSRNFPQMSDKLPDSGMPQPGNVTFCGKNGVVVSTIDIGKDKQMGS